MRNKSYLFIFLFLFIGCIEEKVCNTEYVSNGDEFGIIFEGFNDNETKNLKLVYDKNKKIDYEKDTLTIYTSFNKYISLKSFCITIKDTIKLTDTINIFFQSKKNMLYGFKNVEEEIHYQGCTSSN